MLYQPWALSQKRYLPSNPDIKQMLLWKTTFRLNPCIWITCGSSNDTPVVIKNSFPHFLFLFRNLPILVEDISGNAFVLCISHSLRCSSQLYIFRTLPTKSDMYVALFSDSAYNLVIHKVIYWYYEMPSLP